MSTDKIDNLNVTADLQTKNLISNGLVTNFFKVTNINPSLVVRTGTNPNQSNTNIGNNAGLTNQQSGAIAIGLNAGQFSQGTDAIAIGVEAGRINQGIANVVIGYQTGINITGKESIAIGYQSAISSSIDNALCIGSFNISKTNGGNQAVAIGSQNEVISFNVAIGFQNGFNLNYAGDSILSIGNQNNYQNTTRTIAIGTRCGFQHLSNLCNTFIGYESGYSSTLLASQRNTNIGYQCGYFNQQPSSTSIGFQSGQFSQGSNSVAIGYQTGQISQQSGSTGIGFQAGQFNQGTRSVAIGYFAGNNSLTENSVVIGNNISTSVPNTIVFNPNNTSFTANTSGFFITNIRIDSTTSPGTGLSRLYYNTTTGEITCRI